MGEGLFNLPQTEYPELDFVAEELDMLDKLYSLYTDVLVTINGFEEVGWCLSFLMPTMMCNSM